MSFPDALRTILACALISTCMFCDAVGPILSKHHGERLFNESVVVRQQVGLATRTCATTPAKLSRAERREVHSRIDACVSAGFRLISSLCGALCDIDANPKLRAEWRRERGGLCEGGQVKVELVCIDVALAILEAQQPGIGYHACLSESWSKGRESEVR